MITIDKCALTLSDEMKKKEAEIVAANTTHSGKFPVSKLGPASFPRIIRYNRSLFPNHYLDTQFLQDRSAIMDMCDRFVQFLDDKSVGERDILKWIKEERAYHLVGSILSQTSFGHHSAYIFPEFRLGSNCTPDFVIVGRASGGHEFIFVELEAPRGRIFNKGGAFGDIYRKGIAQVNEWMSWLEANYHSIHLTYDKYTKKQEQLPPEFHHYDSSRIHYCVVAGRRLDYEGNSHPEECYKAKRRADSRQNIMILHYDNVVDCAREAAGKSTY